MTRSLKALVLFPLLAASACTMGPNYERPAVAPPANFRGVNVAPDQARSIADLPWFEMFSEPELAALVREALDNNLDLWTAAARVEEFRGRAALAGAQNKPTVGGTFNASPTGTGETWDNAYFGGLFFNWEIDFFGKFRRGAEAARAELLASEDGTRAVMSLVASTVAQQFVTLKSTDEQIRITQRTITSLEKALNLVQALAQGGVSSGVEVQQAITQLTFTKAALPRLERQALLLENEISILAGRAPGDIARGATRGTWPLAPEIPTGLPSALLERRPDIRAAENVLHAAVARIGVAMAEKIPVPRIGLTGSFGRIGSSLEDFFSGGDKAEGLLSLFPFIDIPLYDGGRTSARERVIRAQAQQAAFGYRSVILQSLREVADALATIQTARAEIAEQEARVKSTTEYVRLADLRFFGGVASYLEVIDAQREQYAAEIDLANARLGELLGVIDLYRALGGGWSEDELKKVLERPLPTTN
jgi:multidrug efflux system outer membrane protein